MRRSSSWLGGNRHGRSRCPVTPEDSISGMLQVIDGLKPEDSGEHIDFTGVRVPW